MPNTPDRLREQGHFIHNPINAEVWNRLKVGQPQLMELFYKIPLSFIVERKKDRGDFPYRTRIGLTDVVERYFGIGIPQVPSKVMGLQTGLSRSGIQVIAQATVLAVEQMSGVQINTCESKGLAAQDELSRIQKMVDLYQRIQQRALIGPDVSTVERAVFDAFLEGEGYAEIASFVSTQLNLQPPIGDKVVNNILNKACGEIDIVQPGRISERSLQARECLRLESEGTYVNARAMKTLQILGFLEAGFGRRQIVEDLQLSSHTYGGLIAMAIKELNSDEQGKKDIEELLGEMGKVELSELKTNARAAFFSKLAGPYLEYRKRLGETEVNGEFICTKLSPIEREVLSLISVGGTETQVGELLGTLRIYAGAIVDVLLEYTKVTTLEERRNERSRVYSSFLRNQDSKVVKIPLKLMHINGIEARSILGSLAGGYTFQNLARYISEQSGKPCSENKVYVFYLRYRALLDRA